MNQAIGVTAEELDCTVLEAFDALVQHAEAIGRTVERLATVVVQHQDRCHR